MLVNGAPGMVALRDGELFSVGGFTISGGQIVAMDILADPERLSGPRPERRGPERRRLALVQIQRQRVDAVALAGGPGPSGKTWPRWPPQRAQTTSVRTIPRLRSSCSSTASATAGSVKLGQPLPESNFVSELNSSSPQAPQR